MNLCLSAIVLLAAQALPAEVPSPMSAAIAAVLQPYVDRRELAGAVALVADRERVLATVAVGWADVAQQRPMASDATFWIASMTKPITATAVMMLVDEGKLALDDPVEQYLPEFRGQMVVQERDENHVLLERATHPFTIREALSHTAGLAFSSPLERPTLDLLPLEWAVKSYACMPLEHQPATQYMYSNEGINTAARVLEVVTGQAFEDFLQARLLTPLGMTDTTFWPSPEQVARLATVYKPNETGDGLEASRSVHVRYPLEQRDGRYPMPGGGLFSTAADVAVFGQMLANGGVWQGRRYLSEAVVAEMTKRQTAPEMDTSYGLGCTVSEFAFGHGGALATNLTIERQSGRVLVWLVQHQGFPGAGGEALGAFHQVARGG